MIAISFHIGRYSALSGAGPRSLFDCYRHDEGYCLWAGPLGLVIYTKRWQPDRRGSDGAAFTEEYRRQRDRITAFTAPLPSARQG